MYFQNMADFLAMGGHGFYVWLAYGIAAVIFAYNVIVPVLGRRRVKAMIQRMRQVNPS